MNGTASNARLVDECLALLPPAIAARFAHDLTWRFLGRNERFRDVARTYRSADELVFGVCQGLFDTKRSTIVIADPQLYVVMHEAMHFADWILGNQTAFRSDHDPILARAFRTHQSTGMTISAYAGVNRIEFTAECLRALRVSSPSSRRPDRDRLARIDVALIHTIESWMDELDKRCRNAEPREITPAPTSPAA